MNSELFKYMVTAAGMVFVPNWKVKECPELMDWKNKLTEYETMAKLTSQLHNSPNIEFLKNGMYSSSMWLKTKIEF